MSLERGGVWAVMSGGCPLNILVLLELCFERLIFVVYLNFRRLFFLRIGAVEGLLTCTLVPSLQRYFCLIHIYTQKILSDTSLLITD